MKQTVYVLALALFATCAVWGATGADFDMTMTADPPEISANEGNVEVTATFTSRIGEIQGWSFGAKVDPDPGVTMTITDVVIPTDINHNLFAQGSPTLCKRPIGKKEANCARIFPRNF